MGLQTPYSNAKTIIITLSGDCTECCAPKQGNLGNKRLQDSMRPCRNIKHPQGGNKNQQLQEKHPREPWGAALKEGR